MLKNINSAVRRASASAIVLVMSAPLAMAQTAADPGVEAINELSGTAATYIAAAFTVAVLVAAGFWGIKMMKKSFGAAK